MSTPAGKRYHRYLEPGEARDIPEATLRYQRGKRARELDGVEPPSVEQSAIGAQLSSDESEEGQDLPRRDLVEEPDEGAIGEQNASEDSDTDGYDSEGVSDSEHADDFFDCPDCDDDRTPFDCGDEDIKNFFEKCAHEVLPNSAINKAQAVLLVLSYVVFAGLTWTQVDGLLKLINTLCGAEVVPRSKFLFRKMWQRHKDSLSTHFFCET